MSPIRTPHGRLRAAVLLAGCMLAMLLTAGAATAAPAGSDNCDYKNAPFIDSLGYQYDPDADGVFEDGNSDEFDQYVDLAVGGQRYVNGDGASACALTNNGREVVYPTTSLAGLDVSRRLYIPNTGTAFARILSVLHNSTSAPITTTLSLECDDAYDSSPCPEDSSGSDNSSPLGSDSSTTVVTSSSGDNIVTADDRWAVSDDSDATGGDNALIHEWDGVNGQDRADSVYLKDGKSAFQVVYNDVTVDPGETAIFMFVVAQRTNRSDAPSAAEAIGAMGTGSDAFAGLSNTDVRELRNWENLDRDGDGVENAQDNCPRNANADQSDIDHDGTGDVCDSDIDGDGLSNSTEQEFGTNPRAADSDGDGVNDKADACPSKPGKAADGCPIAELPAAPKDTTPPNAQVTSVTSASDLADLLNGITVTVSCDEPCQARVRALGRMPTGSAVFSVVGGFNRVLGRTFAPFASGTHTVEVRPCERTPGGAQSNACLKRLRKAGSAKRSFLVKVYVLAADRSGNTKETSKLIRVKRG